MRTVGSCCPYPPTVPTVPVHQLPGLPHSSLHTTGSRSFAATNHSRISGHQFSRYWDCTWRYRMNFVCQSIDKTRMFCAQCIFPLFLITNHTRLFLNVVISSLQDCLWCCTVVLCMFLMITLNPEFLGWKFVFLFLSTTTEYGSLLNVKVYTR